MNAAPIKRPQRWDKPFSDEMTDEDVDRLLTIPPFSNIDPTKFSRQIPLHGILKNDTRIVRYENGDIIVRVDTLEDLPPKPGEPPYLRVARDVRDGGLGLGCSGRGPGGCSAGPGSTWPGPR